MYYNEGVLHDHMLMQKSIYIYRWPNEKETQPLCLCNGATSERYATIYINDLV